MRASIHVGDLVRPSFRPDRLRRRRENFDLIPVVRARSPSQIYLYRGTNGYEITCVKGMRFCLPAGRGHLRWALLDSRLAPEIATRFRLTYIRGLKP